jgi:hypothetical protein
MASAVCSDEYHSPAPTHSSTVMAVTSASHKAVENGFRVSLIFVSIGFSFHS